MSVTLAIDTCNTIISVGLCSGDRVVTRTSTAPMQHSKYCISYIQEVLAEAKLKFTDVTELAVTIGPGSFTGVRIGLAVVKGLLVARAMPVKITTTMAVVAYHAANNANIQNQLIVVLKGGRGQYYTQVFSSDGLTATTEVMLQQQDDVTALISQYPNAIMVGDGAGDFGYMGDLGVNANAQLLLNYAKELTPITASDELAPLYLRPAVDSKLH